MEYQVVVTITGEEIVFNNPNLIDKNSWMNCLLYKRCLEFNKNLFFATNDFNFDCISKEELMKNIPFLSDIKFEEFVKDVDDYNFWGNSYIGSCKYENNTRIFILVVGTIIASRSPYAKLYLFK